MSLALTDYDTQRIKMLELEAKNNILEERIERNEKKYELLEIKFKKLEQAFNSCLSQEGGLSINTTGTLFQPIGNINHQLAGCKLKETEAVRISMIEQQLKNVEEKADKVQEVERTLNILSVRHFELELQLQASLVSTHDGAFLWRIPEVLRRIEDAKLGRITSIYSPPFYTGRNGYKMCIRAYLNGDGSGEGTHLSIFLVLMKGEHDPLLQWPFEPKVSLILVD